MGKTGLFGAKGQVAAPPYTNGAYANNQTHFQRVLGWKYQDTPQTATNTATLTAAQMIGGVLVATPASASTYTTPTGTLLEAALPEGIAVNDCFDLIIINLGGIGDIITLAGGTGVSIVGSATVDDAGADVNSSGIFRFRRTDTNTFVAYRIS